MAYKNDTGYPSVTQILSPWIDTRWFKKIHSVRGNEVHRVVGCKMVKSWAKPINPAWQGYVDSILRWCDANIKEVVEGEVRYQDDLYKYTGKLDLVAWLYGPERSGIDSRLALIDFKTSVATSKTWKLQTGGYKLLFEKHNPDKKIDVRICVRGREDGSKNALVNEYNDHELDQNRFLYANDLYNTLML
jgi:hypothetical protein